MEGAESDDIGASFLTSEPYMVEGHSVHSQQHEDEEKEELPHVLREQDRFLPIANVARIMKRGIPKTGKVSNCSICIYFYFSTYYLRKQLFIYGCLLFSQTAIPHEKELRAYGDQSCNYSLLSKHGLH